MRIYEFNLINMNSKIYLIKTLRKFVFFSSKNVKKRSILYELREKYCFFLEIFNLKFFFKIFAHYFTHFFYELLEYEILNFKKNLKPILNKIPIFEYYNNFLLKPEKCVSLDAPDFFIRKLILEYRNKMIQNTFSKFSNKDKSTSELKKSIKKYGFYLMKKLKVFCFGEKLINKSFKVNPLETKCLFKNNLFEFLKISSKKIFFWEEFLYFLRIKLSTKYGYKLCNNGLIYRPFYFYRTKITFSPKKFLTKIDRCKELKKSLFRNGFYLEFSEKFTIKGSGKKIFNRYLWFLPKLKGHRIFIEIFQRNLNLMFEFERWESKLSSITLLKIFMVNVQSSININTYRLFAFKILNFVYFCRENILKTLKSLEKIFGNARNHIKKTFTDFKKTLSSFRKIYRIERIFNISNGTRIYILLKLTSLINKLISKVTKKTSLTKKNFNFFQINPRQEDDPKKKTFFLKKVKNWQTIFENRFSYLLYSFIDKPIPSFGSIWSELNNFNLRRTGL